MKALWIIGLVSVLMTSCDSGPKKGADGYAFEKKEYEKTSLGVTIVVMDSAKDLRKEAEKYMDKEIAKTVAAFGKISPDTNNCTIYIIDPSVQYEPEFIGHELVHCMYGRWHPTQ
jgi:hypothetical protein